MHFPLWDLKSQLTRLKHSLEQSGERSISFFQIPVFYPQSKDHAKGRSKKPRMRSVCIVALLAAVYGLQHFAEENQFSSLSAYGAKSSIGQSEGGRQRQVDLNQSDRRLAAGDIIFRADNTRLNQIAEQFGVNAGYSQAGIITDEDDQLGVVYAATGGESGSRVVEEPLIDFLQSGKVAHAAVYRLKAPTPKTQRAIASATKICAGQAAPSDPRFEGLDDSQRDRQADCSKRVWQVYRDAGIDSLSHQRKESFALPFSGRYITPDSLSSNTNLRPVYQFTQPDLSESSHSRASASFQMQNAE